MSASVQLHFTLDHELLLCPSVLLSSALIPHLEYIWDLKYVKGFSLGDRPTIATKWYPRIPYWLLQLFACSLIVRSL